LESGFFINEPSNEAIFVVFDGSFYNNEWIEVALQGILPLNEVLASQLHQGLADECHGPYVVGI
jgi:hypothetical protein